MRARTCQAIGLAAVLLTALPARAQTYELAESPREGDCFRLVAETNLTGTLKVTRDGKPASIPIRAKNQHTFVERILATEKGVVGRAVRHYTTAEARATLDGDPVARTLSEGRRLIVAQRGGDGLFCYSPAGPLTRPELEVVSEHFDTLHLTGLLPGKAVSIGDRWKVDSTTAQSLCLFEGLITHELTGTLTGVSGDAASIAVEGPAKGIEHGALVSLTVAATIRYDLNRKRVIAVEWKQKDVRDQGPASPAAEVESTTTLRRDLLETAPAELSDSVVATLPAADGPPVAARQLLHQDPKGRFQLLYGRDWHVVGQTDHHLVLRLLERGDFVAQATLACWQNAGAGRHMSPEEFDRLTAEGNGWKVEQVLNRQEVPTDSDRWAYRITARGTLNGTAVVQHFYAVAGPAGDQMIVTFTMKPAGAGRLGTRDLEIVNAIAFPRK